MKLFYFAMSVLGLLLPFTQFLPWLFEFGLDLPRLLSDASATSISAFAWLDVMVTAVVVIGFIIADALKRNLGLVLVAGLGDLIGGSVLRSSALLVSPRSD